MQNFNSQKIKIYLALKPYRLYMVFLAGVLFLPLLFNALVNTMSGREAFAELSDGSSALTLMLGVGLTYLYILYFSRQHLPACINDLVTNHRIMPVLYAVFVGLLFALCIFAVMAWFPPPEGFNDSRVNSMLEGAALPKWIAIITVVILAPLFEEYIFRSYMFDGLRQKYSMWPTILLTSLLFTMPHMLEYYVYWPAGVIIFALGVVLALFRERYTSLLPSIALHSTYNLSIVGLFFASKMQ